MNLKKKIYGQIAFFAVFLLLTGIGGCGRKDSAYMEFAEESSAKLSGQTGTDETGFGSGTEAPREGVQSGTEALQPETVVVYVCGEVNRPGVYELPAGSRICDAVDAAGGMTALACCDYWNLAELLTDGQMISFLSEEEAALARENMQSVHEASGVGADGRVNINTASLEELMTVPGVGQTRGNAILAYRSECGKFENVEDIKKVSGIGDALFRKMRDYITVD